MASSSSVIHAQIPKVCDLCDSDINIKWKCIQCSHVMCNKCKNIHLHVQISDPHDILDIKSFEPRDVTPSKTIRTVHIPCKEHPSKNSCLLCTTCDQLVCPDCVASVHQKHDFNPINEDVIEKFNHLKDMGKKLCKDLFMCRLKVKEIQATKVKYNSIIDAEISNIKQKELKLKDEISKASLELQKELEVEKQTTNTIFTDTKTLVNGSEKDLEAKQSQIQDALKSNQRNQIFVTASEFRESFKELKFNTELSEIPKFIPSKKSLNIPDAFGSFEKATISPELPGIEFQIVTTRTTELPYISNIIILDEQNAWISNKSKKLLQKVNINDDKTRVNQEISMNVFDMKKTPNTDILLSMLDSSDIKLLTKSGEIKSFLSVYPLFQCRNPCD